MSARNKPPGRRRRSGATPGVTAPALVSRTRRQWEGEGDEYDRRVCNVRRGGGGVVRDRADVWLDQ
jgi:hypothetical protein